MIFVDTKDMVQCLFSDTGSCTKDTLLESEIIIQNSEIRIQKSEIRNQKSEFRNQKSEFRNQNSEIRIQKYDFFPESLKELL